MNACKLAVILMVLIAIGIAAFRGVPTPRHDADTEIDVPPANTVYIHCIAYSDARQSGEAINCIVYGRVPSRFVKVPPK